MFKLIYAIVPHNCGELITNASLKAGATGGTIVMGRGTAASNIAQLLGFGDSYKDIVYIIVEEAILDKVCMAIKAATDNKKRHFGIYFVVDVENFLKSGPVADYKEEIKMETPASYQMINIIVNKGYAEDAMAAARNAGAGGGTIISAKGTAKEGDAKFFGMEIVPEKEMLMILTPNDKTKQVVEAVKALPCFQKAGSGIIACSNASNFTLLGKNK